MIQGPSFDWADDAAVGRLGRHAAVLLGGLVATLALLVLVAWATGNADLTVLGARGATTKANSAIGLLLLAGAQLALVARRSRLAAIFAGAGGSIGVLTLLEHWAGIDLGIDQLIMADPWTSSGAIPGRPSPITAVCLALGGFATLSSTLQVPRLHRIRSSVYLALAFISWFATIGLVASRSLFFDSGSTWFRTLSLPTALSVLGISLGGFALDPRDGVSGLLSSAGPGGTLARRLIVAVATLPAVMGWLRIAGQREGLFGPEIGFSLFALATTIWLGTVVWWTARQLDQLDHQRAVAAVARQRAEQENAVTAARLREATEGVEMGIWEWWLETDRVIWDQRMRSLFEVGPDEKITPATWSARVHPAHSADFAASIPSALASGRYHHTFRLSLPSGAPRWVTARGVVERNEKGDPVRMLGTLVDSTAQLQAEETVRSLLESAPDAMVVSDQDGVIVFANSRAEELFGARREDLVGAGIELLLPEHLRERHVHHRTAFAAAPSTRAMSARGQLLARRLDGTEFPIEVNLAPIETPSGPVVAAAVRDITERRRIEDEARENAERFEAAFESSAIGMAIVGLDDRFIKANEALCRMLGYGDRELQALGLEDVENPADHHLDAHLCEQLHRGEIEAYDVEKRYRHRDGSVVLARLSASSVCDAGGTPLYSVRIIEDITQARAAEDELRRSLAEKDVLLREIHHRVKNNLQVVSSILELQAGRLNEPELQRLFRDSQARIRSMAMIHERLYRSGDLGRIDFGAHLRELARLTVLARSGNGTTVDLELDAQAVELDIDRAIPLGLIANELLTNALRHAFAGRARGRLEVTLGRHDEELVLSVADDGVGLPTDFPGDRNTLGLSLVTGLVRQLRARFDTGPNGPGGARFVLTMGAQEMINV